MKPLSMMLIMTLVTAFFSIDYVEAGSSSRGFTGYRYSSNASNGYRRVTSAARVGRTPTRIYAATTKAVGSRVKVVATGVVKPTFKPSLKQSFYQVHNPAKTIANGHATKHIVEFRKSGITDSKTFQKHVGKVMANPTESKRLLQGRTAHWHEHSKTIVITNPKPSKKDLDGGTAYRGTKSAYDKLK